jgi:BASS family bile acid:Na+ symporter
MKENLQILDPLDPNLGAGEMTLVNIILALVMFGVALGIKLDTFKDVFRYPKSIIVGCMLQWVALPLVTLCVALAFNSLITPMVALGMIWLHRALVVTFQTSCRHTLRVILSYRYR